MTGNSAFRACPHVRRTGVPSDRRPPHHGCLSLPGQYGLVKRPMYAKVRAQDRNGNWFETDGEGLTARCFCHELDHLDGIVYTEVMERFLTDEELEAD